MSRLYASFDIKLELSKPLDIKKGSIKDPFFYL